MAQENTLYRQPLVAAAGVIAIAILLATIIGTYTLYTIRGFDNALSVTGSAKMSVRADSVKWSSTITRTVYENELQSGYAQIAKDGTVVKDFMTKQGIASSSVTITPVFVDQIYNYNANSGGPREYSLRQTITVGSNDVDKITQVANNVQDIIAKGVIFSTSQPEYYYSKLADLRVSLIADAITDAKARAGQLAQSSGSRVGGLKSASTGVVQVLPPNSVDVSDYGQYDTSSIMKDVMVTVRATFVIN